MNEYHQDGANPLTSNQERRPINTDPREYSHESGGQPPFTARPPQRTHSRWTRVGLSLVVLVIILGGLAAATRLLTRTVTETRTFAVGTQPLVQLTNPNGSVQLVSGPAGQISIVAHKQVFAGSSAPTIHYTLSPDQKTLTITVDDVMGFHLFNLGGAVDFELTVPSQADLNVHADNGSLSATGISGQIQMEAGNGSLTASQISATGSSTFKAGNGSITFTGALDRNGGSYLFVADNGSIDLTLPSTANVQVTASHGNGSFDSDFPLAGNGTVGSAPYAQVTIQAGNGSIHLHRGR